VIEAVGAGDMGVGPHRISINGYPLSWMVHFVISAARVYTLGFIKTPANRIVSGSPQMMEPSI